MTLSDYLRVASERWKIVVVGLLVGLASASAATWFIPREYSAQVTIYISAQAGADNTIAAYQGNLLSEQKVKSYTQLLTSHRIAREVVDELRLDVPPAAVANMIGAVARPDTVLLTATATDRSPERAKQVVDATSRAFTRLVAQLEQPTDPLRAPAVSARIVEPAQLPTVPVVPRPTLNFVLGAVLGLLTGYAAALIRSVLDTSVKSTEELRRVTESPNLAEVAFDAGVPKRPLTVHEHPHSPRAEAFRHLRTNFQFIDVDRPRKVVVVTSSVPKEGKSTTLCNLAIALAQAGTKVAVVEGDLRLPRVADYLGIEGGIGLTNVLAGQLDLDHALQTWGEDMFHVLASGPLPANPSELLASQQMANLLAELGQRFQVVLVDAPPLLPVTDAAAVGTACDGALLVVRHGRTSRNQVKASMAALDAVSVPLLGTVLTMTPNAGAGEYYSYYAAAPGSAQRNGKNGKNGKKGESAVGQVPVPSLAMASVRPQSNGDRWTENRPPTSRSTPRPHDGNAVRGELETEHVLQEGPRNHLA